MAKYLTLLGSRGPLTLVGKPRARTMRSGRWIVMMNVKGFRIVCGRGADFYEAYARAYESACWFLQRPHAVSHP